MEEYPEPLEEGEGGVETDESSSDDSEDFDSSVDTASKFSTQDPAVKSLFTTHEDKDSETSSDEGSSEEDIIKEMDKYGVCDDEKEDPAKDEGVASVPQEESEETNEDQIADQEPWMIRPTKKVAFLPEKLLHFLYSNCIHPRPMDITTEFSDSEVFLVDGDALLLDAWSDGNFNRDHGGQMLHFIYLCERKLQLFVRRGGVFHLVFFQVWEKVWENNPSIMLARTVLMLHFKHNTPYKVYTFEGIWSKEFTTHIEHFKPTFLLTKFGAHGLNLSGVEPVLQENLICVTVLCGLNCVDLSYLWPGVSILRGHHVSIQRNEFVRKYTGKIRNVCLNVTLHHKHQDNFMNSVVVSDSVTEIPRFYKLLSVQGVRQSVAVLSVVLHLQKMEEHQWNVNVDLSQSFIAYCSILESFPLKLRGLKPPCVDIPEHVTNFVHEIQLLMKQVLLCLDEHKFFSKDMMKVVADLWHGAFFVSFLCLLDSNLKEEQESILENESRALYEKMISDVERLLSRDLDKSSFLSNRIFTSEISTESNQLSKSPKKCEQTAPASYKAFIDKTLKVIPADAGNNENSHSENCVSCTQAEGTAGNFLLPCSSPLYEEFGKDFLQSDYLVSLPHTDPKVLEMVTRDSDFLELYHWHSNHSIIDELESVKDSSFTVRGCVDDWERRRREKVHALHSRFMYQYGVNLGAKPLVQKPIVCCEEKSRKKQKPQKQSKKALEIIQKCNQERKQELDKKESEKISSAELTVLRLISSNRETEALLYLDNVLKTLKSESCIKKLLLRKAAIYSSLWSKECERHSELAKRDMKIAESFFLTVKLLLNDYRASLSSDEEKVVAGYLYKMGFKDLVKAFSLKGRAKDEAKVSFQMTPIRFQLEYLGHALDRDVRTDPDSRVTEFIPDTWQRELFDVVDKQQSALIVAPTSSGKTYASYYCMEKVLRSSNDGVVVYVSPTKALVNQVAATVCARFSTKTMPPGKTVYGVFTRDYRTNTLNCQILVTVPQCLEILLTSPHQYEWVKRLRYVIFDEVHCLGGYSEDGAVWERIITMIKCPFLALSATIRNPEVLHSWLQDAETFKEKRDKLDGCSRPHSEYMVKLVVHRERHADLTKYLYSTRKYINETGKNEVERVYKHLHPYSLLNDIVLQNHQGIPDHMSLSSKETAELFDVMRQVWPENEQLLTLHPENYFSGYTGFLKRRDVKLYEKCLKELLYEWAKNHNDKFVEVVSNLGSGLNIGIHQFGELCGDFYVCDEIVEFVEKLKADKMLPALIFSYNRELCEEMACIVTDNYETKEVDLMEQEKKYREDQKREKLKKKQQKQEERDAKYEPRPLLPLQLNNRTKPKRSVLSINLLDENILNSCTLRGVGAVDKDDLKFIENRLTLRKKVLRKGKFVTEMVHDDAHDSFIAQLKRGIAYHHSGLGAKRRVSVEMLFRMKFLNVVCATGTLALGVHMPCKTVVIAADSPFLNSLEYHQMSGRAGRRGFDLEGNVIFYGVPQRKMQRLLTAHLPKLVGNFPLTVSCVLNLMLLASKASEGGKESKVAKSDALSRVLTMLNNCLIYKTHRELKAQIQHFFCFSTQLLMFQSLLDTRGNPQCFAGIVTHLSYHEPGNLAFVFLLKSGAFHRLCAKNENGKFRDGALSVLVVVLSYLFARRVLHPSKIHKKYKVSRVILPPMPQMFKEEVEKYNKQVEIVFSRYFRCVAEYCERTMGEDRYLPLSKVEFPTLEGFCPSGGTVEEKLVQGNQVNKICSSFAALSGHGDNKLYDHKSLVSNLRHQVFTDVKVVPILELDVLLNAYAFDFISHGSLEYVKEENGLRAGDDYQLINDFHLVLKCIKSSLEQVAPEDDPVLEAVSLVQTRFSSLFFKEFNIDEYKSI